MTIFPTRVGSDHHGRYHAVPRLLLALLFFCATPLPALATHGQLNINTATAKELEQLPFIGKAKARAILELRRHGQLQDLSQLQQSPAIGPSTYQAIRPYLKLSGTSNLSGGTASPTTTENGSTRVTALILTRPGEVQMLQDNRYYETLSQLIDAAHHRIDMAMFLYKTSDARTNRPRRILKRLAAARKRGVRIQVVLEQSGYDEELNRENRRAAELLRKNGIAVAFDGRKTTTHAKIVVIDQHLCLVGSHNLTHSALARNHEVSLLVDSQDLADQLLGYMETLPQ